MLGNTLVHLVAYICGIQSVKLVSAQTAAFCNIVLEIAK